MDVTAHFLSVAEKRTEFYEALAIARQNSSGRMYIVGGFVYRCIVESLYGNPLLLNDIDIVVERVAEDLIVPSGWQILTNTFGGPKLVTHRWSIDLCPLYELYSLARRRLPATIENYLTGASLNIQCIGYDVDGRQVVGESGIRAIRERIVRLNDPDEMRMYAAKKGIDIRTYMREKAQSLGFQVELPS